MTVQEMFAVLKATPHKWKLDDKGEPDNGAFDNDDPDYGPHNGFQCDVCYLCVCEWCLLNGRKDVLEGLSEGCKSL